jgi:hypothetical protein
MSGKTLVAIWICRIYVLLCLGLGFSTLPLFQPGIFVNLGIVAILVVGRLYLARPLGWLPDGLLVVLPYAWAMNSTLGFQPWWSWMTWAFLAALGATVFTFYFSWLGRPQWRTPGLGRGILLALGFLLLFGSVLKVIFPLFSLANYRVILMTVLLFFGGIPICQLAGVGLVLPWKTSDSRGGEIVS